MSQLNGTITIHRKTSHAYTIVPNALLADECLSWKAKGILAYLIGKPQGWEVRVSDLVNKSSDDKSTAVRTGLAELVACGYAKFERKKAEGRFVAGSYLVSDSPIFKVEPECTCGMSPEEQEAGSPQTNFPREENLNEENLHEENLSLSNKEESKKEISKKPTERKEDPAGAVSSEHAIFFKLWTESFPSYFPFPYTPLGGQDGSALKRLLSASKLSAVPLLAIAKSAWVAGIRDPKKNFWCSKATTISAFATRFNQIRAELSQPSSRPESRQIEEHLECPDATTNPKAHL